ncbi:MAG: zinc-binding dehydrogenase [Streptosporangiales bacterium]|nr:zinc-binding dehydrogenase [Streptosporangiales bacterium]
MPTSVGIPKTSKAAVITAFNEPLEIREIPIPDIEPGALLVRIEAASICGTDVHLWDGSLGASQPIDLPVIPGHEMVGNIVAFGDGAHTDSAGAGLELGDRIVFTHAGCGKCHHCVITGQPSLCRQRRYYIFSNCEQPPYLVGGFAEYCYVFPTSGRIKVPDDVKTEWASAASCALRSVVNSFQRLGTIEPWETVVIQGAGPLGLFATAVASHSGAGRIVVIGDPESRLALARSWGATDTISVADHPEPESRVQAVRELTGGAGSEIVMEFSGARTVFGEGLDMVRDGGRFVIIGQVGPQECLIRPTTVTRRQLTILGSWSGEAAQYWRALQFLSRTKHKFDFDQLLSNRYHLDEINVAMAKMQSYEEIKPIVLPSLAAG